MRVIQQASSDLRLNPHFHTLFLGGVYLPGPDGEAPFFEAAPSPPQEDIEFVVQWARKRILRYLGNALSSPLPPHPKTVR